MNSALLQAGQYKQILNLLLRDEAANTFMLGNLLSYGVVNDYRNLRSGDYIGWFEGGELIGVAAFYNNAQCMVYCPRRCFPQLAGWIGERMPRVVIGGAASIEGLRDMLPPPVDETVRIRRQFFMLSSHAYEAPPLPPGMEIIDARTRIHDRRVQDFILRCMHDGFGFDIGRNTIRRLLRERTEAETYLLLRHNGVYVSQAHIQAMTPHYMQIGGVCTLPHARRAGYARQVLEQLCAWICHHQRRPALVVDRTNTNAYALYASMGFETQCDIMLLDIL